MAEKQQHEASIEYPDPQTGKLVNRKFDMNIAEQRQEMFELLARASHPFAVKSTYSHVQNAGTSIDQTVASGNNIPQPTPIPNASQTAGGVNTRPQSTPAATPSGSQNSGIGSANHSDGFWEKTGKYVANQKGRIAGGAALGTLFMPGLGTIGGALLGLIPKGKGDDADHRGDASH